MQKRNFECIDESANVSKFWTTWIEANCLFVCYGRIGTEGQLNIKEFPDELTAISEQAKVIKSKLKKGYVERT